MPPICEATCRPGGDGILFGARLTQGDGDARRLKECQPPERIVNMKIGRAMIPTHQPLNVRPAEDKSKTTV